MFNERLVCMGLPLGFLNGFLGLFLLCIISARPGVFERHRLTGAEWNLVRSTHKPHPELVRPCARMAPSQARYRCTEYCVCYLIVLVLIWNDTSP